MNLAKREGVGTGRYSLLAPPADTRLLHIPVVEGRWPQPHEANAIVVNRNLQAAEVGLSVGRQLNLLFKGRTVPVRVVGVIEEVSPAAMYTNAATMEQVVGGADTAGALRIVTERGKAEMVASVLEEVLARNGWSPTFLMTQEALRRSMTDHFMILLTLLAAAALAAILVGTLGLVTTLSLNVLERGREIGVMRAIGAERGMILRLLMMEGAVVAASSAVLAVVLALPLSWLVGRVVGQHGLHVTLPFVLSPVAVVFWLGISTITTIVTCYVPSRGALRRPIREVLTHE